MGHVKRANGLMVHENCVYKGQGWQKFSKVNKRGVPFLGKNTEIEKKKRSQSLSYINWSLLAVKNKIKNLKYTFSLANNFSSFFFF